MGNIVKGTERKYYGLLADYDNQISRMSGDIDTAELDILVQKNKLKILKEERDRLIGALGVLAEVQRDELDVKKQTESDRGV